MPTHRRAGLRLVVPAGRAGHRRRRRLRGRAHRRPLLRQLRARERHTGRSAAMLARPHCFGMLGVVHGASAGIANFDNNLWGSHMSDRGMPLPTGDGRRMWLGRAAAPWRRAHTLCLIGRQGACTSLWNRRVKKRASRSELASFDAPLHQPLRGALESCQKIRPPRAWRREADSTGPHQKLCSGCCVPKKAIMRKDLGDNWCNLHSKTRRGWLWGSQGARPLWGSELWAGPKGRRRGGWTIWGKWVKWTWDRSPSVGRPKLTKIWPISTAAFGNWRISPRVGKSPDSRQVFPIV